MNAEAPFQESRRDRRRAGWQFDMKLGQARTRRQFDLAVQGIVDQVVDDRQAESRASLVATGREERLEDARLRFFRDAAAKVADDEIETPCVFEAAISQLDFHTAAGVM